mgnify:CR=1 FL=1
MYAPQYLQCSLITILRQEMKLKDKLSRVLAGQDFDGQAFHRDELERYKAAALCYAMAENAVAVLSDMRTNTSYIYYGRYARVIGLDRKGEHDEVCSIWEEEILKRIHPDDLADKYLQELRFFHFIKRRPQRCRGDYHLMTMLRMKSAVTSGRCTGCSTCRPRRQTDCGLPCVCTVRCRRGWSGARR